MFINYLQFCFTEYSDPDAAVFVGNVTIFILVAQIVFFFLLGVIPVVRNLKLLYKRYQYRRQNKLKKKKPMKEVLQILKKKF
jgi:hypothetical protein